MEFLHVKFRARVEKKFETLDIGNSLRGVMLGCGRLMQPSPDMPSPFTLRIEPEYRKRNYKKGDELVFGISLFGLYQMALPSIIDRLNNVDIGNTKYTRGKVEVLSAAYVDLATGQESTSEIKTSFVMPEVESDFDKVILKTQSPLCIQVNNRMPNTIPFWALFHRGIYRVKDLLKYYYNIDYDVSDNVLQQAKQVRIRQSNLIRYESVNKTKNRFQQGLLGEVLYQGAEIAQLYPYLKFFELVQIGKQTNKGQGMIKFLH